MRERPQADDTKPDVSRQRSQTSKSRSPRTYDDDEEDVKDYTADIMSVFGSLKAICALKVKASMAPLQVKDYVWPEGIKPEQLPNGYVVPQEEALARAQRRAEAAARQAARAAESGSEDEDDETADALLGTRRKSRRITNVGVILIAGGVSS